MTESIWAGAMLCASAFIAGAVNAIAGGGTLLTFPSLLTMVSPVAANATSTMALLPGSFASGVGYRREVAACRHHLIRLLPPSLLGGIVGSLLLIRLPEKVFAGLIPWLLVGASVLLLLQRPLLKWIGKHPHDAPTPGTLAIIIVFQFLVGVYGGYFGAGIGILMLSSLAFVGIPDIHHMNALKAILAGAMNSTSSVILGLGGVVVWKYAAMMAVTAIAGGYFGAHFGRQMRPQYIRAIVVVVGFGVAAYSWISH